ncbi:DUF1692-domain-containing protein [Crepidotus variabilis]|uniref:DUF1692-domain-containing protein n=1 Tax=Crepidotus variabilis TaxID=179855 RepID=A0A9P6JMF3_9AGAR|nr:DUF1692-domain-containing protein [Crepidotus variabilis]
MASSSATEESTLLDKLDSVAPALSKLDAFPKVPSTYKARSESRGFMTIFVAFLAFLLLLNDLSEFIWGWPDYEFSVDNNKNPFLKVNLDMVVAMPCNFLSVDLRDAVGDRLLLVGTMRRDGTFFDVGQATKLKEHAQALSARQAVAQSKKSRGLFDWLRKKKDGFKPTYNHVADASACRIVGSIDVKRVTANLHVTTLGHGYASYEHVDHNQMNLSHIITEFSFGPFFPEIVQPLDNSYETTDKHFVAYQYFLHVVPTTYIAPRTAPLDTAQYSVTHYTRELSHDEGVPGIFFKFDLDPLAIKLHQRTTSFLQLLIRCVGVLGGVFVCMGYAIKVTTRAVEVVSGSDTTPGIVAAESSGVKIGLRAKWGGTELRSRSSKLVPQGHGWTVDGGSPYSSYAGTPVLGAFSPGVPVSPYLNPMPGTPQSVPGTPGGIRSASGGLYPGPPPRSPASFGPRSASGGSNYPSSPLPTAATFGSNAPPGSAPINGSQEHLGNGFENGNGHGLASVPPTPGVGYASYPVPPPPGSANGSNGFSMTPPPKRMAKKDD